ncbi:MAG: hypothetical protein ACYDBV_15485, partial [Nitrospiria bacterium]
MSTPLARMDTFIPPTPLEQTFLGDQPIQSFQTNTVNQFLQKRGNTPLASTIGAAALGTLGEVLNIVPDLGSILPEGVAISRDIAAATDATTVGNIADNAGISLTPELKNALALTKDPATVSNIIGQHMVQSGQIVKDAQGNWIRAVQQTPPSPNVPSISNIPQTALDQTMQSGVYPKLDGTANLLDRYKGQNAGTNLPTNLSSNTSKQAEASIQANIPGGIAASSPSPVVSNTPGVNDFYGNRNPANDFYGNKPVTNALSGGREPQTPVNPTQPLSTVVPQSPQITDQPSPIRTSLPLETTAIPKPVLPTTTQTGSTLPTPPTVPSFNTNLPESTSLINRAYQETVKNGGVTISLGGDQPNNGFAYSPYKGVETVIPKTTFTTQDISSFIDHNYQLLSRPGNHIGIWEDNGSVYLDVSQVGAPTADTLVKAQNANQLSAFDLGNFQEIPLGKIENGVYSKTYEATNHPYLNRGKDAGTNQAGSTGSLSEIPDNQGRELPTPGSGLSGLSAEDKQTLASAAQSAGRTSPVGGAIGEIGSIFNPTPGQNSTAIQHDLRAARGKFDLTKDVAVSNSQSLINQWAKSTPASHLNFIQSVESGTPQPTPELQALADQYRQKFNQDYQLAQTLKPNLPYKADYFAHTGLWQDPKAAEQFFNKWVTQSLGGHPGALESRFFPTILDGIQAGLKVRETNPEVIYLNNHVQLLKAEMAQNFVAEQTAKGTDPVIVQKVLDRYLDPGLKGSQIYQT